jgi:hypothetical protein
MEAPKKEHLGSVKRLMEAPKKEHHDFVKRLLRYVSGTLDYGLLYPSGDGGEINILGFSDSDMAGISMIARALQGWSSS